jgi:hypothetical protein
LNIKSGQTEVTVGAGGGILYPLGVFFTASIQVTGDVPILTGPKGK